MFIANYIYDKPCENSATTIRYTNVFPTNKCFTWNDVGRFMPQQNILMHAIIYRTELLKSCNIKLPKHTFYVDNIILPPRSRFFLKLWKNKIYDIMNVVIIC